MITANRHYRLQAALAVGTTTRARQAWKQVDPADLDGSWRSKRVGERLFVTVAASQLLAASAADSYVADALDEQNIEADAEGAVSPRAFTGTASDGRSLDSLLYEPVIAVKTAVRQAKPVERAMAIGEAALMRIVATQIQDAGRQAVGVGITARPRVGYVRMLNPPSCSRCAVLAGAFYRFNAGFQRHPLCDCRHIPTSEAVAGDLTTDPKAYFQSLSEPEQNRYFTNAGAQAIRDGADIGRVVNARRGMTAAGTTTEAAKRGVRLMPERIYQQATDRADALSLLRQHGYLA